MLRRLAYPSLAAAGVIGLACGAKAPAPGGPGPIDANKDGIADALGSNIRLVDYNGDGVIDGNDTIDINGDGIPDGLALDTDGDGVADAAGKDTNGDGIIDFIDRDGDGKPEEHVDDTSGAGGSVSAGSGGTASVDDADGSEDFDDLVTASGGKGTYVPPEEGEYCDSAAVDFVPKTPTVYVLVDRSNSMFAHTDFWGKLKAAALPVLQELQADVRLGFGSYTGSGGTCEGLTPGAPLALNNYLAIETAYNALSQMGAGDTPTPQAIEEARDLLIEDRTAMGASAGDYYILLITDGDPDFCDNPNPICPADVLVATLQQTAAQGIRTLVFGIDNPELNPQLRQAGIFDVYAQAGWGEEPAWADGLEVGNNNAKLDDQCRSYLPWSAAREANGNAPLPADCVPKPPQGNPECYLPAGNYSQAGGTQKAFLNTDPAALAAQIRTNLEALKSCVFDLSQSNVEVKEDQVSTGEIFVDEVLIPADQWRMNNSTTLELLGAACDTWLKPEVTKFFAGFPCEALIIK